MYDFIIYVYFYIFLFIFLSKIISPKKVS